MSNAANQSQKQAALDYLQALNQKNQLLNHLRHVKDNIVKESNFGDPKQVIQGKDEVVVWVHTHGKAIKSEPYNNEHIMTITFKCGTDKSLHVVEMQDSLFVEELQYRLKKN